MCGWVYVRVGKWILEGINVWEDGWKKLSIKKIIL
jgi:hypothetical protein